MKNILAFAVLFTLFSTLPAFSGAERPDLPPSPGVEKGAEAPDFALEDMQGNSVRLSDYRGKVVFLNFWATWCPPCREEMPSMERLHEVFGKRNFIMLTVNTDEYRDSVETFLEKNPYSFKVLLDSRAEVQDLYGVFRFPETFLIDKEGKLVERIIGARDWSSVNSLKQIETLVGG